MQLEVYMYILLIKQGVFSVHFINLYYRMRVVTYEKTNLFQCIT